MNHHNDSSGIKNENEFRAYFRRRKRQITQKRIEDYVSLLQMIARSEGKRLKPEMVDSEKAITAIAKRLKRFRDTRKGTPPTDGTINDCKTAMRQYCRALNKHSPR